MGKRRNPQRLHPSQPGYGELPSASDKLRVFAYSGAPGAGWTGESTRVAEHAGGASAAAPLDEGSQTIEATAAWYRCPPTFHAFGWIYRRDLLRACVSASEALSPPLNPLDVWVWEVMAQHGMIDEAIAPAR